MSIEIRAEDIEPQRPNIVQEIQAWRLKELNNQMWLEIEEFWPSPYRGPQWPRYGVWFEMEAE
jgi:hypothetical protein